MECCKAQFSALMSSTQWAQVLFMVHTCILWPSRHVRGTKHSITIIFKYSPQVDSASWCQAVLHCYMAACEGMLLSRCQVNHLSWRQSPAWFPQVSVSFLVYLCAAGLTYLVTCLWWPLALSLIYSSNTTRTLASRLHCYPNLFCKCLSYLVRIIFIPTAQGKHVSHSICSNTDVTCWTRSLPY